MNHRLAAASAVMAVSMGLASAGCNCDAGTGTPTLTSLSPDMVLAGDGGFSLALTGSGFIPTSRALWNGSVLPTTFGSATELTAAVEASDVADGGVAVVTVENPGGGISNALPVTIEARQRFASSSDWPSFDGDLSGSDGGSRGPARLVCVGATVPYPCPAGALAYRAPGAPAIGWTARSSLAPEARWVWRGDVALDQVADLAFAVFERSFELGAGPTGHIEVAADDFVEVRVNGSMVGSCGSVTDGGLAYSCQSTGASFDLTPSLRPGVNTLTVVGQNGPFSYAGCASPPCTYATNLAGVLFGGWLSSH